MRLALGILLSCVIALSACAPRTTSSAPSTSSTPQGAPVSAVTIDGRVGNVAVLGESVESLIAKGALAGQTFASPPSTLYRLPGSENLFYVCSTTNTLFQARLLYTEPTNSSLTTPFNVGFGSSLADLEAAGLTEVPSDDPNLRYFNYGYDEGFALTRDVGFYFTYDVAQERITVIDVLSSCA